MRCAKTLQSSQWRFFVIVFFLLIVANFLILLFPYLIDGYIVPIGWDTAWYVRNMRLIEEQGLSALFRETRELNFYSIFEYFLSSTFQISYTVTEKVLPVTIGVLCSLVNFQIIKKFSKSWKLSLIALGFSIVAFNIARMVQDLHRNLFCIFLIQIAIFLILPDILENTSRKKTILFIFLLVVAGISHMETLAFTMVYLLLLLILFVRKPPLAKIKLILICIVIPSMAVFLLESPFLLNYLKGAVFFDASIKFSYEEWVALPWNYFLSLGGPLIPFYIIGLREGVLECRKNQKQQLLLMITLWNIIAIGGSFIPWLGIKIPGYRFLLLTTEPVVATIGFAKFLSYRKLKVEKVALSTAIITLALVSQILYIAYNYNAWLSNDQYERLTWIAKHKREDPCTFVMYFDNGEQTYLTAEMYSFWIKAIVSSKTNVYFGEISYLLKGEPTNSSENKFLNETSFAFWAMMNNFTLENEIYLSDDWYTISQFDEEYLEETAYKGVYKVRK